MPYAVRVNGEIAGDDLSGKRRRAGLKFSRKPIYLSQLAPSIADDPYLETEEITDDQLRAAGGKLTELPRDTIRLPSDAPGLRVLAQRLRIRPDGKREELQERIGTRVGHLIEQGKIADVKRAIDAAGRQGA